MFCRWHYFFWQSAGHDEPRDFKQNVSYAHSIWRKVQTKSIMCELLVNHVFDWAVLIIIYDAVWAAVQLFSKSAQSYYIKKDQLEHFLKITVQLLGSYTLQQLRSHFDNIFYARWFFFNRKKRQSQNLQPFISIYSNW